MADAGPGHQGPEAAELEGNETEQQPRRPLRSRTSQTRSYVRFVNRTQRQVDVIWLNYNGEEQKYKCLGPGQQYKVNTFVTHPWVFRDAENNSTLLINSEEVFFPKPQLPEGQLLVGQASPYHIAAFISIPLYTLKDRAAQVVQSCLSDPIEAYSLDIPQVLMKLLVKLAAEKQRALRNN